MVKMSEEKIVCEGCKEIKESDGLEVSCDSCAKKHGCSECNGQWSVRSRHFCIECDENEGYDMYCCDQCGYEGNCEENLLIINGGIAYHFCDTKCYNEFEEDNGPHPDENDGYDGEDPHYADCSSYQGKKCNCGAFGDDDESVSSGAE